MNTDRTAAPPRPNTLPERFLAQGRTQAAPADAFAALLGAASPAANEVPRREDATRADRPRHDKGGCSQRPRVTGEERAVEKDVPAQATTGEPVAPEADPAPVAAAPVTPGLFALQLASPLPPAPPIAPVTAELAEAPVLPTFTPASVAVTPAIPVAPEAVTAPVAEAPVLPTLPGLIPASALIMAEPATEQVPATPLTLPADALVTPAPAEDAAVALPAGAFQQTGSDAQREEQPATPAPAVASAAAAKPAEPAPAAPTAPQAVAQAAPATPVAPTAGLERAVPLYRAVETTRMLLHVAAERGVTHARLNLKPVELGGIEVRLQSTPQGIAAQLVADSPEAARMLAQASEDLRRQLAERDVTLLSLDVSTASDQRHQAGAGGFADGFGDDHRPGPHGQGRPAGSDEPAAAAPAETTLVLPGGVLVDVLA